MILDGGEVDNGTSDTNGGPVKRQKQVKSHMRVSMITRGNMREHVT